MSLDEFNPYELLGITYNASEKDIRKVIFNKIRENHPDKGGTDDDKVSLKSFLPITYMFNK